VGTGYAVFRTSPLWARPGRRLLFAALTLAGCLGRSCYENNPEQRRFLGGLSALARPALAANNPLAVEEAAKQSVALAEKVGAFADWCGTLSIIEGSASKPTVAIEVGPQVSLYAFNDWTLAFAGSVADMFSTRNKEAPPPGLSDAAVAALKTFRLGDRVLLSGRLGEIAGVTTAGEGGAGSSRAGGASATGRSPTVCGPMATHRTIAPPWNILPTHCAAERMPG